MKFLKSTPASRFASIALLAVLLLSACGGDKPEAMLASARDYLAKNDPKAAIIQLKNALQNNPELPEARFLMGRALLRGGDPVGAETELRKALELKHPADLVIPPLAQAMLAQQQFKKITDELGQYDLATPSAKAELQTYLASAYRAQGNGARAKSAIDAALAADPAYAPAVLAQARARAAEGDFDAALVAVDAMVAKKPDNAQAWKLKGDIHLHGKGTAEEALAAYRKSVEVQPDFLDGHAAIITTLLQQAKVQEADKQFAVFKKLAPGSFQAKYFDALLAYQKKDFKLARELSQQLMKVAPDNNLSLQLAGAAELQANSLLQAEAYLSKVVQSLPEALFARRLLVSTYLKSGQPAKALSTLLPALKVDRGDPVVNTLAGEVYLQNGDYKKAEQYFAAAAKQDPKNSRARTSLALTHLASGQESAAYSELQEIAASDSGTTADMALISTHLRRGNFDQALRAIDALEKKQPDKPFAANLRGRTLLALKDASGARKSFERSASIDPAYFPSIASLAALDIAEKKPDDARKRFEAVLVKDPKNAQALLAIAELKARAGGAKEEVAELITRAITANPTEKAPRLLLVDFHLRNNDNKQALSVAENAVATISDSFELLDALGRAQLASGDTNQAMATFNKVAAMQPLSPLPQMRLAEANIASKNPEAAVQSLRKALDVKADFLDAQRGLIVLAMDSKNFDEATRMARTIQKQRPKQGDGYKFEGDIAAIQKKWDLAIDAYRNGLKQAPSTSLAVKMDAALRAADKTAELEKFESSWLSEHPQDPAFRLYLADFAVSRSNFAAAEKMYNAVLQLEPTNSMALNNLAWVTGKLNKDGAIRYAEKAIALMPDQAAYQDTLAMLLSEKNDYAKAVEWQNKALALQPQNGMYRLNLAKIHIRAGKKDLARKELDVLAKLGDKFARKVEVDSLLKSL